MSEQKLGIAEIRYNPERGGFEAQVSLRDASRIYHYPAFLPAPLHAEFDLVAQGLVERALATHRSARPGLRMALRPLVQRDPRGPDTALPLVA